MSLRPCPKCRRHMREDQCPFCGASIESIRDASHPRVSRAVMFATAATVALVTECGQSSAPVPFYGGCPACTNDASDASEVLDASDASDVSDALSSDAPD